MSPIRTVSGRRRTPDLTATSERVYGALCFLRKASAVDLALVTGLSVHVVRRALADLRELGLASADRLRGHATGNVWTASPARTCAREGCDQPVEFTDPHWGPYCRPLCGLEAEAEAA